MASRNKGKQRSQEDSKTKQSTTVEGERLVIDKWDSAAVKNALDDTAKKIMAKDFNCEEDFNMIDRRLFLCTLACSFSVFALVYDYLSPFPRSGTVLAICAISYFILMGVLSFYTMLVEGSVFMVARQKDPAGMGPDVVWKLSSSLPRFGHVYSMSVEYLGGQANTRGSSKIEHSVTNWFDEDGGLVYDSFHLEFIKLCKNAMSSSKTQ